MALDQARQESARLRHAARAAEEPSQPRGRGSKPAKMADPVAERDLKVIDAKRDAARDTGRALRAASERADAAEAHSKGLAAKLAAAEANAKTLEANVNALREQLREQGYGPTHPEPRAIPAKLPGRRYAPAKLPKLVPNGAASAPGLRKKPPMDLRTLEEGFDNSAFPSVGIKSRSGLRARPMRAADE